MLKKRSARRDTKEFKANQHEGDIMIDSSAKVESVVSDSIVIQSNENSLSGDSHSSTLEAVEFLHDQIVLKSHESILIEKPVPSGDGVPLPMTLRPNFRLLWGDGPRDQIETDDVETLLLEAFNPYTNVIIKNLTVVSIELSIDNKPPENLPDETASVSITPSKMIRLGDLAAHSSSSPAPSVQELVLLSRGAKQGDYEVRLHFCFSVELTQSGSQGFKLELVRS